MTHLIVELSDSEAWGQPDHLVGATSPRIIPIARRPTMLQTDRVTAEREAKRLASMHPGKVFVVFAPVCAGITTQIPTHITLDGRAILSKTVAAIADIQDPNEIPF